jgi:putative intracellular protease/amidase
MKLNRRNFGRGALVFGVSATAAGFGWQHATDYPVVAMVDDGVTLLDVVGPMEILGRLPHASPTYVSAAGGGIVAARGPMRMEQTIAMAERQNPKIIILPGTANNPTPGQINWLKKTAPSADAVIAPGHGGKWLSNAGLKPDGRRIVACAGGAGALDAALSIAARIAGPAYAQGLQLGIEYDPAPPFPAISISTVPATVLPLAIDILLYEGMTALDAIGPYEVFSRLPGADIRLVGVGPGVINTDTGALFLKTGFGFTAERNTDIVVVPGGSYGTLRAAEDPAIINWLKRHLAVPERRIISVCTGALILAATGALKGLTATTHWASRDYLEEAGSTYVQKRYVEHGRLVTAAGVSAGIDVALAMVGELRGQAVGAAIQAALPYVPAPPYNAGSTRHAPKNVVAIAEEQLQSNALKSATRIKYRELRGRA